MSSPKTSDHFHKVTREHIKNVKTGAERLDRHSGKFETIRIEAYIYRGLPVLGIFESRNPFDCIPFILNTVVST